jgi:hypothetical protein
MVTERAHEGKPVFLCDICGFGYEGRETAEECEDYCSTYSSCSLKITAKAVYIPEEPKIKESE